MQVSETSYSKAISFGVLNFRLIVVSSFEVGIASMKVHSMLCEFHPLKCSWLGLHLLQRPILGIAWLECLEAECVAARVTSE